MKRNRMWSLHAARRAAMKAGKRAKAAAISALILQRLKTVGGSA